MKLKKMVTDIILTILLILVVVATVYQAHALLVMFKKGEPIERQDNGKSR
jgi:hypothetical protein